MKGYLGNGLFSLADRMLNDHLAARLRAEFPDLDLYVPQENDAINDKSLYADSVMIARADLERLEGSDLMIAVIDGVEIDSGLACEIGAFYMMKRPIFALFTDVRQQGTSNERKIEALRRDPTENQFIYRNLFVVGVIKLSGGGIYATIDDLIAGMRAYMAERLDNPVR